MSVSDSDAERWKARAETAERDLAAERIMADLIGLGSRANLERAERAEAECDALRTALAELLDCTRLDDRRASEAEKRARAALAAPTQESVDG